MSFCGKVHLLMGQPAEALVLFEIALECDPKVAETHYLKGLVVQAL